MRDLPILKQKPAYGTPCNHCGQCCLESVCSIGAMVLDRSWGDIEEGPCPALRWHGNESRCGLVVDPLAYAHPKAPGRTAPSRLSAAVKAIENMGYGCTMRFWNEPDAPASFYRRIERAQRDHGRFMIWLGRKFRHWMGGIDT